MKPHIARLKQALAALLAAAILILSPGLPAYAAAATLSRRVSVAVPVNPGPAGLGSTVSGRAALGSTLSLTLAPAALTQFSHPTAAGPAVLAAPVQKTGTEPLIPALPQALAAAAPLAAPLIAAPHSDNLASPLASLQASQDKLSAVIADRKTTREGARVAAAAPFDGSQTKAADAEPAAEAAPLADVPAAAKKTTSALRRAAVHAAGGTATAAVLIGIQHAVQTGAIQLPAWHQVLDAVGAAGYYIGNAISFVFAIPQILKTFEDGHHGATPVKRALLGTAASLALGLVSAPLAGQLFWGVQNVFGGLTLLAPLAIGKLLAKSGVQLSGAGAMAATAAACAALLAVSFGLYAAAAALVPAVLPVLLGKAGISALTLAIQVATGAAFLALFTPDIGAILKKKAPEGFTPFFSLLFAVASIGFIAWTLQKAVAAPLNSPEQVRYIIYAAQNVVYAVVAMLSYAHSRKHERKAQAGRP